MCSSKLIGALFVLAGLAAHAQPPDVPALHAALESGRFEEGLSLASAMIRTRPNDPGLWTARGLALAGMNQAQQSLASFDRALALNPKFVPALRAAAQTAYQQKDPRAAGYLKRLLALEPANEAAHGMAAVTAFDRSDCQQAVAHFALSGSRAQADPLAASMYAQCLLRLNRASLAVDVLAASLSAHPSRHDLRYNLAVAQSAADQTEGALQTLAGLDSSSAALTLIGMLRVKSGDVEGAVAALTQAIRLTPADEQPYVELTLLCARR